MMTGFVIGCCWLISFLFSGIESGVLSIDPVRLRQNVKRKVPAAIRLNQLLKYPERLLVTVLLVTNAADILGLLFLTRALLKSFGYAGFVVAFLVALPVYLFVLGVLPKSLFRRFPFAALARLGGLLDFVSFLLWPVLELGSKLGRLLLPRRAEKGRLFAAREELKQITVQSEREGSISAIERAMIDNVVDFSNVRVRDVMVAGTKVVSVYSDASIEEAIKLSAASGVDRLPVVTRSGEPTGLINILEVLLEKNGKKPLNHYMRRIVLTDEQESSYRIVQRLRAARLGLAAVLDRDRKLCGVVTMEDLIRRLVSSSESRA